MSYPVRPRYFAWAAAFWGALFCPCAANSCRRRILRVTPMNDGFYEIMQT